MPLLGFKKRFAPAVENGEKRQTIRARRKDGRDPKAGDTLYLYMGLRTKKCRPLGVERCTAVKEVTIDESGIVLDGADLTRRECNEFAKADGFVMFDELVDYWQHEHGRDLPWHGIVIYW